MEVIYPQYTFTREDAADQLARFVRLDNPESYPFDAYHSHEYNEMLVFTKGGGIHNIEFREYPIRDNSIHLLGAGNLHWVERGMRSEGFAVVYKEQFLYKLQQYHSGLDFVNIFSASEVINLDEAAGHFNLLFHEILNNRADKAYMLSLIGSLLTKIAITCFPGEASRARKIATDPVLIGLARLINMHFKEHLPAAEYARKLHLSLSALERKIKAASGKSITALQQERLLKEAKKMLCQPGATVKETAWQLGFREAAHFSNWFKKQARVNPAAFAKALSTSLLLTLQPVLEQLSL